MKLIYLTTISAVAATTLTGQQQYKVCTSDKECNTGFYCKPTTDGKFSMCQPNEVKPNGAQYSVCKTEADCNSGLYCGPTNDATFSMCQSKPKEKSFGHYLRRDAKSAEQQNVCNENYSQCGG